MVCMYMPGGFICGPVPRNRRCACGAESTQLCDHRLAGVKSCDCGLCARCAYSMGGGKHLCRQHYEQGRAAGTIPPRVWNKADPRLPRGAIYVGWPSKWGNPYSHKPEAAARYRVATHREAVACHAAWLARFLAKHPDARGRIQAELRGKDLACHCKPRPCHADVLFAIANEIQESTA